MSHHLRRGLVFLGFCLGAALLPLLGRADDEAPAGGRRFALLVGVRDYNPDEFRSLRYTENDVNNLAQLLRDAGYRRVVLLTQSEAASQHNPRLQPTGKNIRDQLRALLEECKPADSVVIGLSGHGVQPRGQKGSYFCPMDAEVTDAATLVAVADVYKSLEDSKAGVKVLLVDACRNDALVETNKGLPKLNLESLTRPVEEAPPSGVAALFACSAGEQAYESKHYEHGIFFHFVLEGLKGEAANKDGSVTLQRLVGYVKDEAPLQAKEECGPHRALQHPELLGNLNRTGAAPLVTAVLKEEITNRIGMKLKLIRPGKFLMGSPKDEDGRKDDEGPQHEVEITKAYYMGVYPVTKGQFAAFVKDASYSTEAETANEKGTWRNPGFAFYNQMDNDPVVYVSWNDAVKFCEWLSQKEGKAYELPTEAEWEYACRAATTTAFSFPDPKDIGDYAWYGDTAGGHPHPVGGKKPNPWGLYDMHGNVWQWCADGYGPYQEGYIKDPKGKDTSNYRVLRGGSCYGYGAPRFCRSAGRSVNVPANRSCVIGFRVVLRPSARTP